MNNNIVFVHCDSMDGRAMGCMGHPAAHTPNIDRLAAAGTMFATTYCNSPICVPSRSSMFSGLFTHRCEGWNNFKGLEPAAPTFVNRLEQAGYRCVLHGKTDYLSGDHTLRARVSPWTRSAGIALPHYRMPAPHVDDTDTERVHRGDWRNLDKCVEWLNTKRTKSDRPFFLYLGPDAPHPEFTTSRRYLDLIDPAKVSIPSTGSSEHPVMNYMRKIKNWSHGLDEPLVRLVRRVYLAMIAEVDAMVGQLREAVHRAGLDDSTWFIFGSDHGELAMEHGQYYKMAPYEASVRVPLIIAGPGAATRHRVEQPVSLVDVHPTLLEMAGSAPADGLDGHSLMPQVRGRKSDRPDWALSECHDSGCLTGWFMLRREQWKYIAFPGFEPMLFDLDDDPDELTSLAMALPDVAAAMDTRLRSMVDYEAVDRKVKAYDRAAFARWRQSALADGSYRDTMAKIHSGWDGLKDGDPDTIAWDDANEQRIVDWMASRGN